MHDRPIVPKDKEEESSRTEANLITALPPEMQCHIDKFLDKDGRRNLYLARPSLFNEIAYRYKLRSLLSHTALGEREQAQKIYEADPYLLTIRGTVYHPNRVYPDGGHPIDIPEEWSPGRHRFSDLTALQIAWANEDFAAAALMCHYLTEKEIKKQFLQVFPDAKMQYPQDLEIAQTILQDLLTAVIQDQTINCDDLDVMNTVTRNALTVLRDYIKPKLEHRQGLLVDPGIYLEARQLYNNNWRQSLNEAQRKFWHTRVKEMIASVLGMGYLSCHTEVSDQGLHHRGGCLLADGSSYFSFRRGLDSIPGFNFFKSDKAGSILHSNLIKTRNRSKKELMLKYSDNMKREEGLMDYNQFVEIDRKASWCVIA